MGENSICTLNHELLLAPLFSYSPPPSTHLQSIRQETEAASLQKHSLQKKKIWGITTKKWLITPHPQYPLGLISNAPFSLKPSLILDVIIPCFEPTAFSGNLPNLIYTVFTPIWPHSVYKIISFSGQALSQPSPPHPHSHNTPWAQNVFKSILSENFVSV